MEMVLFQGQAILKSFVKNSNRREVPHRETTIGRIPAYIVRAGECMAISARMLAT